MSKSQLQTNNSKLSALITELQGKAAGGGSGGGSVETCTVVLTAEQYGYRPYYYAYTEYGSDGSIVGKAVSGNEEYGVTLVNVVKNSVVTVCWWNASDYQTCTNADLLASYTSYTKVYTYIVRGTDDSPSIIDNTNPFAGGAVD